MKKIRIKVKTLIIVLVSIVIIFGYIAPSIMFKITKDISYKNREKAIKLYSIYLNTLSFNKKDEALYNMATFMVPSIDTYDIFMGMRGGGGYNLTKDRVEKVIGYYEKILDKYGRSKYYDKAYKNLLDIYTALGNLDKAYELMDWGKKSSNEEIRYISHLYKAFYYFADREYDKGLNIIDHYIDEGKEDRELYILKGHIYFAKEEYDKVGKLYKLAETTSHIYDEDENLFGNLKKSYPSLWIDEFSKYKGDHRFKGKVTFNGKGMPFVQIYVRDISKYGTYSSSGENFVAITDSNGEFETPGFREGQYEIGIGISQPLAYDMIYMEKDIRKLDLYEDMVYDFNFTSPMEMISPRGQYTLKDKEFTLKWEEVEGAEYYRVKAISFEDPFKMEGSSSTFSIPDKYGKYEIKGTEAILNLNVLNSVGSGLSYSGEDMIINPHGILGPFYPQSNVPIIISAYNKEDTLINSTLPMISFYDNITTIKVDNRQLTEGENLILHRKYDEAVSYYEELIKKDSTHKEALIYLSRLYTKGWRKNTQDFDRGIEYSFRLYNLTENRYVLENLLSFIDMENREKYLEVGERVFELIPDESLDNDLLWEKGKYYALKGDFNNARKYYENLGEYYVNPDIIYIDIYNEQFDKALNRLEDDNFKFWSISKRNLTIGIEGLKEIDKDSKAWLEFKEFLSKEIKRETSEDNFNKVYKNTKNPSIKLILKEIGMDNHWLK